MITEDYISFETAKLLKEKGFECEKDSITAMYDEIGKFRPLSTAADEYYYDYSDFDEYDYVAPTLQMAMKWLREVHKTHIEIRITNHSVSKMFDIPKYYWIIFNSEKAKWMDESTRHDVAGFDTYEQACEAAIKYCLEKLI